MISINNKKIAVIAQIATELVNKQTGEELATICEQAGKMYTAGEIAAEVAVKLMLRILGLQIEGRGVSPVDGLVDQAEAYYTENFAG